MSGLLWVGAMGMAAARGAAGALSCLGNRPARQVARAKERWSGLQAPHRLAHWEPKTWACACFLNNQPSSAAEPGVQNELGEPASLVSIALGSAVALVDSEELESVGVSVGWT